MYADGHGSAEGGKVDAVGARAVSLSGQEGMATYGERSWGWP